MNDFILLGPVGDAAVVGPPCAELELGVPLPLALPATPSSLTEVEDEAKFDMKLYKFLLLVDPVDGDLVR